LAGCANANGNSKALSEHDVAKNVLQA